MAKVTLPVPKFRKGKWYVAMRNSGQVQMVQCKLTKPQVVLHPPNSTFAFSLDHFDWVIDIPANQALV